MNRNDSEEITNEIPPYKILYNEMPEKLIEKVIALSSQAIE